MLNVKDFIGKLPICKKITPRLSCNIKCQLKHLPLKNPNTNLPAIMTSNTLVHLLDTIRATATMCRTFINNIDLRLKNSHRIIWMSIRSCSFLIQQTLTIHHRHVCQSVLHKRRVWWLACLNIAKQVASVTTACNGWAIVIKIVCLCHKIWIVKAFNLFVKF